MEINVCLFIKTETIPPRILFTYYLLHVKPQVPNIQAGPSPGILPRGGRTRNYRDS